MCVESREWMKFGGKAFFCLTVSGLLRRDTQPRTDIYIYKKLFSDGFSTLKRLNIKQDVSDKLSHYSEEASL